MQSFYLSIPATSNMHILVNEIVTIVLLALSSDELPSVALAAWL